MALHQFQALLTDYCRGRQEKFATSGLKVRSGTGVSLGDACTTYFHLKAMFVINLYHPFPCQHFAVKCFYCLHKSIKQNNISDAHISDFFITIATSCVCILLLSN